MTEQLTWKQIGLASNLARELRALNRISRTEIDGHTFTYADLKDIWVSSNEQHIILTQHKDPTWQHWTLLTEHKRWQFVAVYKTAPDAEKAVAGYRYGATPEKPGTYVVAWLTPESRVIRVRCESKAGPTVIKDIFTNLGYSTNLETVE